MKKHVQSHILEVKFSDDRLSKNFQHFILYFSSTVCLQLVKNLSREKTYLNGVEVRSLIPWLGRVDLLKKEEL